VAERRGHGWWPYWVPFFGFLLLVSIGGSLPDAAQPLWLVVKVALPGGLFLWFAARGAYPELRGFRATPGGLALDVAVGLAGAALWVAPYLVFDSLRPASPGFDAGIFGPGREALALGVRGLGYVAVTPFVEELFMRSWLLRYLEVFDRRADFRDVPIAHFSWRSFAIVVAFFLASHMPWEWWGMSVWAVGTMLWFYHRKHIVPLIVVHAVSNAAILALAIWGDGRFRDGSGNPIALWFFV
jgi:CAAX prenyl protease-like protein